MNVVGGLGGAEVTPAMLGRALEQTQTLGRGRAGLAPIYLGEAV